MKYFDADMNLRYLGPDEWQLYRTMDGVELAAEEITKEINRSLKLMISFVTEGDGVLTAGRKTYEHIYQVLKKYDDFGACDTEPRGVLASILDEYAMRRFEVETDLYWDS